VQGIKKSAIFEDDKDRARLVQRLGETVSAAFGSLYAWVLMRNRKKAISAYRRFVGEGMAEGRNPMLVGGGLIRSQGGWSQVVALRRRGHEEEADERILGSGDFVPGVPQAAEERLLRRIKLRRLGRSITDIIEEECKTRGISPEELKGGGRRVRVSEARAAIACRSKDELGLSGAEIARHPG